jgi:hypothetical protein
VLDTQRENNESKGNEFMKSVMSKMMMLILVTGFTASSVFAKDAVPNRKKHPRRAEVVGRVNNEKNKNNAAAVNGKLTDRQAKKLDRQDNRIDKEEQADAKANGGHITKGEQKSLNRQENGVNRERNNMEKRDATKSTGSAPVSGQPAQPVAPATTN